MILTLRRLAVAGLLLGAGGLVWAGEEPAAAIERDWRLQDGIGTAREAVDFATAIRLVLERGDALSTRGDLPAELVEAWRALRSEWAAGVAFEAHERFWRRAHDVRRAMLLADPLLKFGPLVFVKHVPSMFSHQLTQSTGNCARPGGGLFVLEEPGRSMKVRQLARELPLGSYEFADVSYDGARVLFAFCKVENTPKDRVEHLDHHYHLYETAADGSSLRQLTNGPFDDFAGRYLPNGKLIFISSRRGGFHRCGAGPCQVHTLAICEGDGSNPHPVSFHETHEWDPAVLDDGRVVYTRWDYVDRNAVHYQQLWTVRPDGCDVRAYYGNHTLNPVGVWEARAIPGTSQIMATAAAHHAMTAGSIIRLDVTRGLDGLGPITRLTPDALFPESEAPVANLSHTGAWNSSYAAEPGLEIPVEARRWPGHCYKSPYPLSPTLFLAAYSFDPLIGEPDANPAAMFGLYVVDAWGNKELLYRDPDVSSLWPMPLVPRQRPPIVTGVEPDTALARQHEGTFFVENVSASWPVLEPGTVKRLRILQVLPKSTWNANDPMLGLASASPGKQVLGTVRVEADGSAYFRAPAGIPLLFQALDEKGEALQTMRSLTYLQPGEQLSCVGCHEHRSDAPMSRTLALANRKDASTIQPGPDGSSPLSYPILVQPALDRNCVACHQAGKAEGGVILTGEPAGHYTASYNALAALVSYSDWAGKAGDFRVVNREPLSPPGFFGARGSKLTGYLDGAHHGVKLPPEDRERFVTWMDANGLFYGTFDPADQARQQRGERIAGAKIE